MRSRNVMVICAITLLSTAFVQPFNITQPYPKLESVLSQMISADDPQEFAQNHNLYMQDGKVRVVVELINETLEVPDYFVEETRYKNKIQGLVPIEKISNLSEETNVTFIRAPLKPYADTPNVTAIQTPPPKTGFNTAPFFILSIVLIFLIRKMWGDDIVKK